ncbi:MAG: FtsW/RodA/SpoVE family cell cycle protein, partial [Actinomycetota bacterium]|nr:FtsW/RodA/SpoVE family cell cycle protein [Actinomycetota bacterium]
MLSIEKGGSRPTANPPRRARDVLNGLFDTLALIAAVALVALGALNNYAIAGWPAAARQLLVVTPGLVLLVALRRVRPDSLVRLGWGCYGLSVLLLVAVMVIGVETKGAQRWLGFGSFSLQPSELAKLGLLLVLAHILASDRPARWRFFSAVGVSAVPVALTLLQPDLSTAMLLSALMVAMLVLGRIPLRFLLPPAVAAAVIAPLALPLLHSYQLERLQGFFTRSGADGASYTLQQAHIAFASGGLTGRFGDPADRVLAQYLPENQSDLAFASLAQQFGLVAGIAATVVTLLLVWRMALASRSTRTRLGMLVGAGLAILLGTQVVVSVAGNLGLLPIAGIPFPLLSYGGTAAIAYLAGFGVVLGVRRDGARRRLWAPPRWVQATVYPRGLKRIAFLLSGVLIGCAVYGRHLQTARGESLRQAAQTQMTRCVRIPAARGIITDRHGTPLATNAPGNSVAAVPALLRRHPRAVGQLAELLGRPVPELRRTLGDTGAGSMAVRLAQVDEETGRRVAAARIPGVVLLPSSRRVYPHGPLLAPFLGFVGADTAADHKRWPGLPLGERIGRAGIEQRYDPVLRGVAGEQCFLVDPPGEPVAPSRYREPAPGLELRLAVDLGLQQQLNDALAGALSSSGGDLAAAVAMDPKTGQVLALASLPSHDNNAYGPPIDAAALAQARAAPGHPTLDHATQVAAPPGSTFKAVVAAANLVDPELPPDQIIPTGASFTSGGHSFGNWKPMGPQNLVQALTWSNDVYFYKLALMLGPERIHEVGTALGVGQPTGIDLPAESAGHLGTPESARQRQRRWYPAATVVLGIGQGDVTATPLQTARWMAAIATGQLVTPRLGMTFATGGDEPAPVPGPPPAPLPFASVLEPVREGMRQAVSGGTARVLSALPAPAMAKTGTAQDPASPNGDTDAWMMAAAPADDPAIAVVAFV